MTIVLHWRGWFEIRTSTDPDPTDEPRGVSGYTFAVPGEPDLDRVVRFQNPRAPRAPGPTVGVEVWRVDVDGVEAPKHPLLHAAVDLLETPREEQRNNALDPDNGYMFIDPFHIQVAKDGFVLARRDDIVPGDPKSTFLDASFDQLRRRGFRSMSGALPPGESFAAIAGADDPVSYRLRRRGLVEARLNDLLRRRAEGDDSLPLRREIAGLKFRADQLMNPNSADRPTVRLTACWSRHFRINGAVRYEDPARILDAPPESGEEWPVAFWFGVFDCDANVAWASGTLTVPQKVPFGRG